jgi:CrcB protein
LSTTSLLLVALGGAAGSVLRHLISLLAAAHLGTGFPYGTLAVNVLGSALIGIAAGLGVSGEVRLLLVTGVLGGFTTFSAFSLETGVLYERTPLLAALYVALSLALGLAAFAGGVHVTRR